MSITSSTVCGAAAAASAIINREIRRGPHPESIFFPPRLPCFGFVSLRTIIVLATASADGAPPLANPTARDPTEPIYFRNTLPNNNRLLNRYFIVMH